MTHQYIVIVTKQGCAAWLYVQLQKSDLYAAVKVDDGVSTSEIIGVGNESVTGGLQNVEHTRCIGSDGVATL